MELNEKGYFLLIASRSEDLHGKSITGEEMAKRRLEAKEWGFYANTPHKGKIKKGDQVIVYLAGPKDMHFFATATAGDIHQNTRSYTADGDALTDIPVAVLSLSDLFFFKKQTMIHEVKDALDFIPKATNKWGCVLQRGLKMISQKDAETILKYSTLQQ